MGTVRVNEGTSHLKKYLFNVLIFERHREKQTQTEIFQPPDHYPNVCNSQGWTRALSWSPMWVEVQLPHHVSRKLDLKCDALWYCNLTSLKTSLTCFTTMPMPSTVLRLLKVWWERHAKDRILQSFSVQRALQTVAFLCDAESRSHIRDDKSTVCVGSPRGASLSSPHLFRCCICTAE